MTDATPPPLSPGLYDSLLSTQLALRLSSLSDPRLATIAPVDPADSPAALAQYLEHTIAAALARFRGTDTIDRQRVLVNTLDEADCATNRLVGFPPSGHTDAGTAEMNLESR